LKEKEVGSSISQHKLLKAVYKQKAAEIFVAAT
jgi:hypothetical protein